MSAGSLVKYTQLSRDRSGRSQEPATPSGSLTCVAGTQVLKASPVAFQVYITKYLKLIMWSWDLNPGIPIWNVGVPSNILTTEVKDCHLCYFWSCTVTFKTNSINSRLIHLSVIMNHLCISVSVQLTKPI